MKQIYLVNKSKAVLGLFSGVKSRITLTQPLFKHYCVLTVALMLLLGGFSTRAWGTNYKWVAYTAVGKGSGTAKVEIINDGLGTTDNDNSTSGSSPVKAEHEIKNIYGTWANSLVQKRKAKYTATATTGYHIVGWYTNKDCTEGGQLGSSYTTIAQKNAGGTANLGTYYAKFELNTYKVKFNKNGGSGTMSDQEFTYGTAQNLTANVFTRSGYVFLRWDTKSDGTGTPYSNQQSVNYLTEENGATVNLYAIWGRLAATTPSAGLVSFEDVVVESTSNWKALSIEHYRAGTVTLSQTGDAGDFFIGEQTTSTSECSSFTSSASLSTKTIQVQFRPTQNGLRTCTLTVSSNVSNVPSVVYYLRGAGYNTPSITWNGNNGDELTSGSTTLSAGDTLRASCITGQTVSYPSYSTTYFTATTDANGNPVLVVREDISGTVNNLTVTANLAKNTSNYYEAYSDDFVLNVTNLIPQAIVWTRDLANIGDDEIGNTYTLDAYAINAKTGEATGSEMTYQMAANDYFTLSGNQLTVNAIGGPVVVTVTAAGSEQYAPATVSKSAEVLDMSTPCRESDSHSNGSFKEGGNHDIYPVLPTSLTFTAKREKNTLLKDLKVTQYNSSGTIVKDTTISWSNISTSGSPYTVTSDPSVKTIRFKASSSARYTYYITNISTPRKTTSTINQTELSYATAPGQSLGKTVTITYSNRPIFLSFKSDEKAGSTGHSKWSLSDTRFGGCGLSGSKTVTVTFESNTKGSFTDTLYVRNNVGDLLHFVKLTAVVTAQQQFLDAWNIADEYNTTDKVTLSASTKANLTDFTFSVETSNPNNIVTIDENGVMQFSASGTATIKAYQPGGGIYDEFTTTHNITINKVTPTIVTAPTGSAVTYLQKLENSTLTTTNALAEVTFRGTAHTSVAGDWKWTNKDYQVVEAAGSHSYDVTFTPSDGGMYTTATGSVNITVNKAPQTLEMSNGEVYVKVTGLDASAANSLLNLNSLIASQTQDPVAANHAGEVSYEVISAEGATISDATISGSTFYATAIGTYTIVATKAATDYYTQKTDTFTVVVKKRANTLTVVGAQEKYVDQNVTSVASLINSDASLQYSSTAEDIARYDVANNRIVVDNSASKSFDDTLVTISIWQEANSQFEASGVKTIDVTVKKRENAISYTWDGQAHTSWIEKLSFDQSATVLFSATNTQTGCPDVTVAQTYGSLNASYTQAENKIKASYINDSYATWQISQAESRTYQGATATLRVNVGTETSTGCDLYVSDWWDEEKTASQIHIPMPETGTAGELTFDMRKNGSLGDDALLCIQVGTQWDTIHVWAKEKDNYKAPNGITLPYTLDPNTTAIRFDKYATALSGFEITSDDPFIRNIHVTRKTWLKLEDADKNEISKLVMPTNTVSLFGSNSRTAEFYINYSTCDSKVHIASNNSSISTSVSEFDIDHLGRKRIIVTYTSNQVENINATITVYTQYENKTLTIEAKTEKENQSIIWANGYTGNPLTLPLGLNAVNAATSTSHAPVTYTSQNESIIKVSDDGLSFQMMGAGTTTLTAYAEGDDTHWNPVSETKTVTVSGKQVQQIVWTHNYTHGLHPGETANLDAIAMVINAQTGAGTKNDSLTALIAYEAINNDCVISISGNTLNLLKEGNAQIKATLAGSDEFETAEPVILDVHVRAVSTGECDPSYMFESGQGEELGFYAFDGSPSLVGGLHWETPELFNYVNLNHDNTSGDPDTLTYSVRGKAYRALGSDHFQGTIEVWESEDGINYTKVANSVVQPVQDQTVPSGKIVLKSTTTHLKFVRPANGQGYHYVRDIKVTRLAALTSDNTIVNGLPEVNLGDVMAGAERNDVITFTYASVKGDLTTSKQNSTNSNNVLTINEPVIELDCGDFDTHDLPITFRPMEAGPWSEEVKITDPLADMSYTVRVKANVTVGAQMIIWNPTQTIDFDEPPLLDGYATSGLTVSYSVTAGTDVATIENGVVVLHKPGSFTITASQGGNTSFSPADDVVIPFTVTLSHYTYTGNGNWEDDSNWNVVPEGEHPDVIVRGDLEINDTVTVGSMTIESNGSVMVVDNGTLTVNGTSEDRSGYGDLHVEKEGHVFLNNGELKVNKFILDATLNDIVNGQEAKSGQVTNPTRLDIIETAYFDLDMDPDGQVTFGWYDFTVPFDVNISNGIFRLNNDGSTTPLVSGRDFIVTYYDEARRAAGQKGWVQMNGSAQLTAGVAYSITLDDEVTQNTIRFVWNKQHSIGASYSTPVTRSNNGTTTNRGWNGIGNGTLTHTQLQGLPANTKVQMYDHSTKSFRAVDAADYTYAVGTAFFYQAPENPSPVVQTKADGTLLLPLRAPQYENRTVNEFRLTLTEESTAREVDVLYVSASEEATGEYTVGHDLLKMASANEVSIAQIWATNGKLQLCDIEMPLINNNAICDLGLNAPKEGAYILEIQRAPEDAMLYLTYEGRAIWNLSYSPYVFDLAKGTTEGYGLKLYANPAPQVATGVDEMDAEAQTMRKVMIDNVLYIITPDGAMYDVTGKSVK